MQELLVTSEAFVYELIFRDLFHVLNHMQLHIPLYNLITHNIPQFNNLFSQFLKFHNVSISLSYLFALFPDIVILLNFDSNSILSFSTSSNLFFLFDFFYQKKIEHHR